MQSDFRKLLPIFAAVVVASNSCYAQGRVPTAVGIWERLNANGRTEARFRIYQCGASYFGKIVSIAPKQQGEDPSEWRCIKCEGQQKGAPVLGLTFIKDMKRSGLQYRDGTILDPRDGSVYSALMELSAGGSELRVRGYLFTPFLGQDEIWHRVNDSKVNGSNVTPRSDLCTSEDL